MNKRASIQRGYSRPSTVAPPDESGMFSDTTLELSREDMLRRQLLEKDRENDKVRAVSGCDRSVLIWMGQLRNKLEQLQTELQKRPSAQRVEEVQKEFSNLELILQGTQRENERCMAELQRCASSVSLQEAKYSPTSVF
jgi:hypothetical protein